jgi:hypothetical protein
MSRAEWPPKRPDPTPPNLERVRVLWRVQATSGRIWQCALYQVATGRELRLEFGFDRVDRANSRRVAVRSVLPR